MLGSHMLPEFHMIVCIVLDSQVKPRTDPDEDCVVALLDQWYLDYGEPGWRSIVETHLKTNFNAFEANVQVR